MQQIPEKPPITFRLASLDAVLLIQELARQVWPQTYAPILPPAQITFMMNMMYSKEALQQQMEAQHQFLIVYDNSQPVGFTSYSQLNATQYKLHKIYLLPRQQGRGLGRIIIEQIEKAIAPKGATSLLLNVNRNNEARFFYQKLGFEIIRTEDVSIGEGYFMNDYIMEKKLNSPHTLPEV